MAYNLQDEPPTERIIPSDYRAPFIAGPKFRDHAPDAAAWYQPGPMTELPPLDKERPISYHALPSAFERALAIVKNVVVIVTCLVLLYTFWRGYVAISAIGDAFENFSNNINLGN